MVEGMVSANPRYARVGFRGVIYLYSFVNHRWRPVGTLALSFTHKTRKLAVGAARRWLKRLGIKERKG